MKLRVSKNALMGGKTVDNIATLDLLLYDGTRLTVGPTTLLRFHLQDPASLHVATLNPSITMHPGNTVFARQNVCNRKD